MAGQFGTKETKELLYLVKCITLPIVREAKKDGFQATDILAFVKSPEFEAAVMPAVDGAELIDDEFAEIDVLDGLSLGKYVYGLVMDIVEEVRAAQKKA